MAKKQLKTLCLTLMCFFVYVCVCVGGRYLCEFIHMCVSNKEMLLEARISLLSLYFRNTGFCPRAVKYNIF